MEHRSYRWFRARFEGLSPNSAFIAVVSDRNEREPDRVVDSDDAMRRFVTAS